MMFLYKFVECFYKKWLLLSLVLILQTNTTRSRKKFYYFYVHIMYQETLLRHSDLQRSLQDQQVQASFTTLTSLGEKMHDVVLEVNSQKFLIRIKAGLQKLEKFEVLAVRWFVELWVKVLNTLRRIVTVLYFQS